MIIHIFLTVFYAANTALFVIMCPNTLCINYLHIMYIVAFIYVFFNIEHNRCS